MDALAGLLLLFDANTILALLGGVGYGLVIGIIPGLGGGAALTIRLPFTFAMEPNTAFAAIVGMMAASSIDTKTRKVSAAVHMPAASLNRW